MYEIIPNLFLGNIKDAQNAQNMNLIINCSKDIPFYSSSAKNMRLAIHDNLDPKEIQSFHNQWFNYISVIEANISTQKILVHCYAGRQRSAALICAYLMWKYRYNLNYCINYIKSKKQDAFFLNINFLDALLKIERSLLLNKKDKNKILETTRYTRDLKMLYFN
jgi:protein-tyrosine phosphatase